MRVFYRILSAAGFAVVVAALGMVSQIAEGGDDCPDRKARRFLFTYKVVVTDLPPGTPARLWIPLPSSDRHQTVVINSTALPGSFRITRETQFGNGMFYVVATASPRGEIPLAIEYEVLRREVLPADGERLKRKDRQLFTRPNRLVPVGGKPFLKLLGKKLEGEDRDIGRRIFDLVDQYVRYRKPPGGQWGRGDANWVCDSGYGNCSDFHSLFISLSRSVGLPSRFCIGFPIGEKSEADVGGYHCWAEFAVGNRWFAVDVSEADKNPQKRDEFFGRLPADRVMFSVGRDLQLNPPQKSGPVNFFVYPHVEINGKPHEKMKTHFRYKLIPGDADEGED